ncbi:hypothetical protein GN244_ATG12156 [Phytophthora infestans]|uniref:Uncharacterized protein n=1 Tax=Phytophthora infestans TaxID=4787 RepID=A0A833SM14_PHYIN|nr:hypothetical protein GN244_ATG12156 [Phytophthora infestans]KAF4141738.1 hypothetical protein GN958_ATG09068 [Phytophthora infestans]
MPAAPPPRRPTESSKMRVEPRHRRLECVAYRYAVVALTSVTEVTSTNHVLPLVRIKNVHFKVVLSA